MSRTKKGKKGPGHEYWGKRPGKNISPGKTAKKATHRLERIESKKVAEKESEFYDDGIYDEYCDLCGFYTDECECSYY